MLKCSFQLLCKSACWWIVHWAANSYLLQFIYLGGGGGGKKNQACPHIRFLGGEGFSGEPNSKMKIVKRGGSLNWEPWFLWQRRLYRISLSREAFRSRSHWGTIAVSGFHPFFRWKGSVAIAIRWWTDSGNWLCWEFEFVRSRRSRSSKRTV